MKGLYKLNAIIEQDKNGYYAFCPTLPGCHTEGDGFEEAMENMKEAVALYLETLDNWGDFYL